MELEQAKLEELEGGDSRIADEEDYDDMDDVGMDHTRGYGFGGSGSNEDGKDDADEGGIGRPRPNPLGGNSLQYHCFIRFILIPIVTQGLVCVFRLSRVLQATLALEANSPRGGPMEAKTVEIAPFRTREHGITRHPCIHLFSLGTSLHVVALTWISKPCSFRYLNLIFVICFRLFCRVNFLYVFFMLVLLSYVFCVLSQDSGIQATVQMTLALLLPFL